MFNKQSNQDPTKQGLNLDIKEAYVIASGLHDIADGLKAIAKALTQGPDDSQPEQPETYLDGKPVNERPVPPPPPDTGAVLRKGI